MHHSTKQLAFQTKFKKKVDRNVLFSRKLDFQSILNLPKYIWNWICMEFSVVQLFLLETQVYFGIPTGFPSVFTIKNSI